jgi:predicted amidohydrolase YtcJ
MKIFERISKTMSIKLIPIFLLTLTLFSCGEKPDVIYKNAKIYTLNSSNDIADAIAIKDGKILEVGKGQDLESKYEADDVVDLKGSVVLPGLVDTEGSIVEFSKNMNYIDLSNARSLKEIKDLVIERTGKVTGGETIGGYGWNELNLTDSELQQIDKQILDDIAPGYNVFLLNASMTTVWVNSRMLRTLNIDSNTKAPEGGEIQKFDDGEPTGLFFGEAVNIIRDNLPRPLRTDMLNLVERGVKEIVKYGITEVHDRTVNKESIDIFKQLIDSNRFPLRVYAVLSGEDSALTGTFLRNGIEKDYKSKLTIRAISLDYDGAFDMQQAVMNDQYKEDPKVRMPYVTENDLERIYTAANEKKFQFRVKAVGDKAIGTVLSVIEKSGSADGIRERRTMIEHCEFVSPKELAKIGAVKLIPSVRPDISMTNLQIAGELIRPENALKTGLWNSLLKSAGMITSGSDFPYHQINPFVQMYYLVTRQPVDTLLNNLANPNEKLSILDALKSYTVWPAYASFQESEKGSLEKGKYADLIVISKDIFNEQPKALLETKVLRTMIRGRIVYDNIFDPEKL